VAALNGVLGDYLVTTGNPLATPMTLRAMVAGPAAPQAACWCCCTACA
jgi:hypothetical protein